MLHIYKCFQVLGAIQLLCLYYLIFLVYICSFVCLCCNYFTCSFIVSLQGSCHCTASKTYFQGTHTSIDLSLFAKLMSPSQSIAILNKLHTSKSKQDLGGLKHYIFLENLEIVQTLDFSFVLSKSQVNKCSKVYKYFNDLKALIINDKSFCNSSNFIFA